MKTLSERNKETAAARKKMRDEEHYGYAGVACDKCGTEMVYSDGMVLMSNPTQKNVKCLSCGFTGRVVG